MLAGEDGPRLPGSHRPTGMGGPRERAGPGAAGARGQVPNAAITKAKMEAMHVLVTESGARDENAALATGGPAILRDLDAGAGQRGQGMPVAGRVGNMAEEGGAEGSPRMREDQKVRMP